MTSAVPRPFILHLVPTTHRPPLYRPVDPSTTCSGGARRRDSLPLQFLCIALTQRGLRPTRPDRRGPGRSAPRHWGHARSSADVRRVDRRSLAFDRWASPPWTSGGLASSAPVPVARRWGPPTATGTRLRYPPPVTPPLARPCGAARLRRTAAGKASGGGKRRAAGPPPARPTEATHRHCDASQEETTQQRCNSLLRLSPGACPDPLTGGVPPGPPRSARRHWSPSTKVTAARALRPPRSRLRLVARSRKGVRSSAVGVCSRDVL